MLALEVEYLMGRVLAAGHHDRRAVEWPPHPSRLFSALVAAYKECELGDEARTALEWLEALPAPDIYAQPPQHDEFVRDVADLFVPVNDHESDEKSGYWSGRVSRYDLLTQRIARLRDALSRLGGLDQENGKGEDIKQVARLVQETVNERGLGIETAKKKSFLKQVEELLENPCATEARRIVGNVLSELFESRQELLKAALGIFPDQRDRQLRWFPAFAPADHRVWFTWNGGPYAEHYVQALQRVAENVPYLGHSMSPVRVRVKDSAPAPTLIPDPKGRIMLRTIGPGRLRHLEHVYELRKANAMIQPHLGHVTRYRVATHLKAAMPASVFRQALVFRRIDGPSLSLESVAKLTATVRKAVMALFPDPVPEAISGHTANGARLQQPHLAVAPLADVGHRYADGHLMGFALWLPASAPPNIYETLEDRLQQLHSVMLGRYGVWKVEPVTADFEVRTAAALRLATYTKAAKIWASLTPVVFGKFPRRYQVGPGKDGGKVFAELCEMIGLPKPAEVRLGPVSAFRGVPKASDFIPSGKFSDRFRAHVWVRFDQPVQGPVILGAGRYLGFGLCRPWFREKHP